MITIALDECGHFELEDFAFVGGLVYEGEDYKEEEVRILNFLEKCCKEVNANYPKDLHFDKKSNKKSKKNVVIKVKECVSKNIATYLKENGKYHIVCMVRDNTYRKDYNTKSNLIDDNFAGNRYEHMMCETINNIIFNNILKEEKNINLNIATRISVIPLEEKNMIKQFEKLGYKQKDSTTSYTSKNKTKFPAKMFFGTDEKTFKTFLSTIMLYKMNNKNHKEEINFNKINITSIDYKNSDNMAFLYLSDFVCNYIKSSYLKESLNKEYSYNFDFNEFYKDALEISANKEPYIWVYEDIDGIYNKIMDSYNEKNIFNILSYLYDGSKSESKYAKFYNEYWFKKILNKLKGYRITDIENAINLLEENMDKSYQKLDFIFKGLKKLMEDENIKKERRYNEIEYKLADLGLRIYNHLGDIKKSDEQFEICKKSKDNVPIEKYLETANRQSVNCSNKFEFERALELSEYNEECFKIIKETKKEIAELNENKGEASWKVSELGKCLSSSGQYLAFIRKEEAIKKFEEAIEEFNGEENNIRKTLSYILHFAIDKNDKDLYEKNCVKYFYGAESFEEQFNNIINGTFKESDRDYGLYVLVKALDKMYSDEVKLDFINKIRTTDYKNKLKFKIDSHPWELIYKHLASLYLKKDEERYFKDCIDKALNIESNELTIKIIKHSIELEKLFLLDDVKGLNKKINEFKKLIEDKDIVYFKECIKENNIDTYKNIINKITFMYS